ncbi:hypothetical protein LOD99_14393 [Oopsacas minuta]|uniref:Gelsolin-like domain-containing protein n=1 Tax=Oopsacas minuta TaxID=111878 RepID=A0AAV7KFF7_9METZ|nr:hypothetical protein LOD99_14393 [Oopsacas minuta]
MSESEEYDDFDTREEANTLQEKKRKNILNFVKGIDLSSYPFQSQDFPDILQDMRGLRWLSLSSTCLEAMPPELGAITTLERISLDRNNLRSLLDQDILAKENLPHLSQINARHNKLEDKGLTDKFFHSISPELKNLDLSHNNLSTIPKQVRLLQNLIILNLSHNEIQVLPTELFTACTGLQHLDLSNNQLQTLPIQFIRLSRLQHLDLSNNPLQHYAFRKAFERLTKLQFLNLSDTGRCYLDSQDQISGQQTNINNLQKLVCLRDLDLSHNQLTRIPTELFKLTNLRRLNLSYCELKDIPSSIETWIQLQTLDLSGNSICFLPHNLCELTQLKRIFLSDNRLQMDGIPKNIGNMINLESFIAARNQLVSVPASMCTCLQLKKLVLTSNRLITLPEGFRSMTQLVKLELDDNPQLIVPPKQKEEVVDHFKQAINQEFKKGVVTIDPKTNKLRGAARHRRRKLLQLQGTLSQDQDTSPLGNKSALLKQPSLTPHDAAEAEKVLRGLADVADKQNRSYQDESEFSSDVSSLFGEKLSWEDKLLKRPDLDYSLIFDSSQEIGTSSGITIWTIDQLAPCQVPSSCHGTFSSGDCYIVLYTFEEENLRTNWDIYFWIGSESSLDKRALAAIHAVHLRNFLGAKCRTKRVEMGDESSEFLNIFPDGIRYSEGRQASVLRPVQIVVPETRLYRILTPAVNIPPIMEPLPLSYLSLDLSVPHLFEAPEFNVIFIWACSRLGRGTISKARLVAEDMKWIEYRGKVQVITIYAGNEPKKFWDALGGYPPSDYEIPNNTILNEVKPPKPKLFSVCLEKDSLELPQLRFPEYRPDRKILDCGHVFILDSHSQVFVWQGRKASGILRNAGLFLAEEIMEMFPRPDHVSARLISQGLEPIAFRSQFSKWDSQAKNPTYQLTDEANLNLSGLSLNSIASNTPNFSSRNPPAPTQTLKLDISVLFQQRNMTMDRERYHLLKDSSRNLIRIECFILRGDLCEPLPQEAKGHFYSQESYAFVADYFEELPEGSKEDPEEYRVVYFWQGKDAKESIWVKFQFNDFFVEVDEKGKRQRLSWEDFIGPDFELVRYKQQGEEFKFLAHFGQKIIVHKGAYNTSLEPSGPCLYQIRAKYSKICRRIVQVNPVSPTMLNSEFCCILRIPFPGTSGSGITYVWLGSKASQEEELHAEQMGRVMSPPSYALQVIREGNEPDNFFWAAMGGRPAPDFELEHVADYLRHARLFKCTNERGFFRVSELLLDFHQGDLNNDDVMILDTGKEVFIWFGNAASDVEKKLAARSCELYLKHLEQSTTEPKRKLKVTKPGREPWVFRRCFHGWDPWKE